MLAMSTTITDRIKSWYAIESKSATYDIFIRYPALAYFSLLLWLQIRAVSEAWANTHAGMDSSAFWSLAARVSALSMIAVFAALTLVRSSPVARADGLTPRIVAAVGAGFLFAMVFLERAEPSVAWDLASAVCIATGNAMAVVVVLGLGRAFSTMPEARQLVVSGPYRLVRHPLYLAEQIAVLGMLMQYRSAAALAMLAAQVTLQIRRMHYEEAVLTRAFPEYRDYARRTARIIPGIY